MVRRFAAFFFSALLVAALTSSSVSASTASGPSPNVAPAPIVATDITPSTAASGALSCSALCVLSDTPGAYTLLLDQGADLRVDGDVMVNQNSWYTGAQAINRCGSSPCSPSTCTDLSPSPGDHRVQMCGSSFYVDHSISSTDSTLSARTISVNGGWQARVDTDVVHADRLAATCPAHPKFLGYPPLLQETNVCIGVPQIADPLNDPSHPENFIRPPDPNALSSCPGATYACGPVAAGSCRAEPGSMLALPVGTLQSPARLTIQGPSQAYTICPGLYFGGFSVFGDSSSQPRITMLPGIYYMVGGGFSVAGRAGITSVSSQGDGVMIYNSDGAQSFSESFPPDPTVIPSSCPPPVGSACHELGSHVLNPPSSASIRVGDPVTYRFAFNPGPSLPHPTITLSSVVFYNGSTPIDCEGGILYTGTGVTNADCTTRYTTFGDKGITAVYVGDDVYAAAGDSKTQTVAPPPTESAGALDLNTVTCAFCNPDVPLEPVVLHAPTSGRFSGLLMFQDRGIGLPGVRISPAVGTDSCAGSWMTQAAPPAPCGPLGGLSGTIYAPHLSNGSPADWDSVVDIKANGAASLQVIAAQVHFTGLNKQTRLSFLPADRLVVTPSTAQIAPAGSQAFSVEAFDADGHSQGDVTASSTFEIVDGSCSGAICTATVSGSHLVTATYGDLSATATLTVIAGPFDHLAIVPASASIAAGGTQTYTAEGRDAYDNSLGSVTGVGYAISPNGSCTNGKCTATLAGVHTVTGTKPGMSATATLTVVPAALDRLVLSPATATVLAGVAQAYSAEGRDRFNNSLGDVTAGTTFSIAPNGSCATASCNATVPGGHTVTGVNSGKSGKATLTVKAGPLDHLALAPASASIVFGASQAYTATGRDAFNNSLGTVSGVTYSVGPDGGCSNAVCTPASVGPHTVTGTKSGVSGTAGLTVTKANPTLTYTGKTSAVRGSTFSVSATLKRSNGVAIAGATISFTVNGQTYTAVTNASGVASTTATAPPAAGTYSITTAFAGNGSFNSASLTKNLVVS